MIEDQGPQPTSSRNSCLDLIRTCDALILAVGPRGGFRSPSGRLVVEEEFDEARRLGRPSWMFIQTCERDDDGADLVTRLSDYVGGRYRGEYADQNELERLCTTVLNPVVPTLMGVPFDPSAVQNALSFTARRLDSPRIRLAFAPQREGELVDPLDFASEDFGRALLAHAHESRLFNYSYGSQLSSSADTVTAEQVSAQDTVAASIRLHSSGLLIVERAVGSTGRHRGISSWSLSDMFELLASDLDEAVGASFAAAARVLDQVDPHHRYPELQYNAALGGTGHRKIVDRLSDSQSYQSGLSETGPVRAYAAPRAVSRSELSAANEEISRTVKMLKQRVSDEQRPTWER